MKRKINIKKWNSNAYSTHLLSIKRYQTRDNKLPINDWNSAPLKLLINFSISRFNSDEVELTNEAWYSSSCSKARCASKYVLLFNYFCKKINICKYFEFFKSLHGEKPLYLHFCAQASFPFSLAYFRRYHFEIESVFFGTINNCKFPNDIHQNYVINDN